jgi:hypothetical protein
LLPHWQFLEPSFESNRCPKAGSLVHPRQRLPPLSGGIECALNDVSALNDTLPSIAEAFKTTMRDIFVNAKYSCNALKQHEFMGHVCRKL